jgi:hypothetical protein
MEVPPVVLRQAGLWCLITLCAFPPTVWGTEESPLPAAKTLFVYPANHGFLHQTGQHVPYGWAAMYRIHDPGYFIEGQSNGGEALNPGVYRYLFSFNLLPGQLGGLLSKADDVVRIEAWDTTTHEILMSRTFQVYDFLPPSRRPRVKAITFSTHGRAGHRFEPRIYWPGLSGVLVQGITLQRLSDFDLKNLENKALLFEEAMGRQYLNRGYVLGRHLDGRWEDMGDAGIWTGLYAVSQAWRYKATRSKEALARMHDSLRALHELYHLSPQAGTLSRYVYPDGRLHPQPASKDTYTGFFFAMAHCLPYIKDKALKKNLLLDMEGMAAHFLDHDLRFVPEKGPAVDLNPSFSAIQLTEGLEALKHDDRDRQRAIRILEAIHFYFLIHAQRPWPELPRMIRHLKDKDFEAVRRQLLPFMNGALGALQQLQRNVHKSAIVWRWRDAPYQKLDHVLLQMIRNLKPSSSGFQSTEDLKVLASSSIHALHILKIAGEILPKPNRYQAYYRDNLWQNKVLLKTAVEWNGIDEEMIVAVAGDAQAAATRGSSNHLGFLALLNLMEKERDPNVRKIYQSLFERKYKPLIADYNAMTQVMQPIFRQGPTQTGLAFWSLMFYPENRQGKGEAYWQAQREELAAKYGGTVAGKLRDPRPVNELQRDAFIWQRSARSLRGDSASQLYPPLDYLFVYWMARAYGQTKAFE